jgi:serine phosphatase RsbU (regulator of sigma subunit)
VTLQDSGHTTERVERVPDRELAWVAQHRLTLLIECSAAINAASTEEGLVAAALDAALAGGGFRRVAWLRQGRGDAELEVVGFRAHGRESAVQFAFSNSLIREAAAGQIVRLTEDAPLNHGQSIVNLGIHSALCAPIVLGGSVAGYLYFDARGQESPVHPEAAGFCQAISRMCGLALANLKRAELERRQQRLDSDLHTAREAQQLIMPPAEGQAGALRYALRNKPGRTVAGDLFDLVVLPGDRVALCIGDVCGESIGAGILMATTQAFLHAALLRHQDASLALTAVNDYLTARCAPGRFVTMWVGILDPDGTLSFVDAGHGHWLLTRAGQSPQRVVTPGGIPLAIEPGYRYKLDKLALQPGDRLLLFSDGVYEQRSPTGEQFGQQRIIEIIAKLDAVDRDISAIFDAVQRFACTDMLDDDATAASVEIIHAP